MGVGNSEERQRERQRERERERERELVPPRGRTTLRGIRES